MSGMSERKLTEKQEARIEAIKKVWFQELEHLPEVSAKGGLSHASNYARLALEKKYCPQIKKIMEE